MTVASFARLATSNTYDNARRNLSSRQTTLANLQENLTSGKRVVNASDDPTGAAQAERAQTRIERVKADQRALESQRNAIAEAEGALGTVTDALQSFRELVVAAGNPTYTAKERQSVAVQLSGLRDQIFSLANQKDSNGMPLFSALGSALAPFVGPNTPPQDYTFQGLPGQSASSEVAIPFSLDGESAFMHQTPRDGVFNVQVSNANAQGKIISADRSLTTGNVIVTDNAVIAATAAATSTATGGAQSFPQYAIQFTALDTTTTPGMITATYDVNEIVAGSPPTTTPVVSGGTVTYKAGEATKITLLDNPNPLDKTQGLGAPGMSLTINAIPPSTDKNNPTPTGSPAVGDTITIDPSGSIFNVLDNAIRDVGSAANANAASQGVAQALNNIDIGMGRISAERGKAGDLLNRADRITTNQEKRNVQLEADRSRAEDLDMIKGVSDFQSQQTAYSAALQSYAQIQKLSLFNFIG